MLKHLPFHMSADPMREFFNKLIHVMTVLNDYSRTIRDRHEALSIVHQILRECEVLLRFDKSKTHFFSLDPVLHRVMPHSRASVRISFIQKLDEFCEVQQQCYTTGVIVPNSPINLANRNLMEKLFVLFQYDAELQPLPPHMARDAAGTEFPPSPLSPPLPTTHVAEPKSIPVKESRIPTRAIPQTMAAVVPAAFPMVSPTAFGGVARVDSIMRRWEFK